MEGEGEWEGRERGTEGCREGEMTGGSEAGYYKGREGVIGWRVGGKGERDGRM